MHPASATGKPRIWLGLLMILTLIAPAWGEQAEWRIGLAKARVTPEEPIRMAGYGGREKPSQGVLSDLHVKAMAIEGAGARPALLVTADLINFRAPTWQEICRRIGEKTGLPVSLEQTGGNNLRCMVLDIGAGKIKIT